DVEASADAVEDFHAWPSLAAPLRRRDSLFEYPLRAPRDGGGDSLRCRSSRPGHDIVELVAPFPQNTDLSRSGAVMRDHSSSSLSCAVGGARPMARYRVTLDRSRTNRRFNHRALHWSRPRLSSTRLPRWGIREGSRVFTRGRIEMARAPQW